MVWRQLLHGGNDECNTTLREYTADLNWDNKLPTSQSNMQLHSRS